MFAVIKESGSSWDNLSVIDTPLKAKRVHDILLIIHDINCSFLSAIVESNDTIRDSLGLYELNPSNFGGVIAMSTTACFSINTLDIDNSKFITWNNTTLIQMETKF